MNVEARILDDWPGESPVQIACLEIWAKLRHGELLDHYSFDDLKAIGGIESASELATALLYLASPSVKVLKAGLMYEFDGQLIELPENELLHFVNGDPVVSPSSGSQLSQSEILVTFEPGDSLRSGGAT